MSDKEKTTIRSKGASIDDAVNEALLRLGARRDEVEITVLEEGKPGVLGVFGRKRAEVEVTRKAGGRSRGGRGGRSRDQGDRAESRGRGRGRGRGRDRDDANRSERSEKAKEEPRREARRGENGPETRAEGGETRRRRRRRPARDEADAAKETPQKQAVAARDQGGDDDQKNDGETRRRRRRGGRRRRRRSDGDGPAGDAPQTRAVGSAEVNGNLIPSDDAEEVNGNLRGREDEAEKYAPRFDEDGNRLPRERRPRRERRSREERPAAAQVERETPVSQKSPETPVPPTGEPIAVAETTARVAAGATAAETVTELAGELFRRCGFFASVRTLEPGDDGRLPVRVVVDADSVEAMVGRRSSAISSAQHLIERLNQRASGEFLPLDLDINNYRQRQDGKLTRMAHDAIGRVQQTGEEDHLPPMNARDRRVIHMEVAEVEGLHTYTVGQGMDRHVVICVDRGDANPPSEPDAPRP